MLDCVRKSLYVKQLEILMRRLSTHDVTEALEKAYGREIAGYSGEKKLPYYLQMVPREKRLLFGVRIPWQNHFFQIDNLSFFQNRLFLCEVKHLKGTLSINEAGQLTQETADGKLEIYDNPLVQATFQREKLTNVLHLHDFNIPTIHPIVVFTHPSANLTFQHPDMLPIQQLPHRITELLQQDTQPHYSLSEHRQLMDFIAKHHQERNVNILDKFQIHPRKLIRGVFCPTCKNVKANRVYGTWQCSKCGRKDKMMHVEALKEWALLFQPTITNKQARWFLTNISIDLTKRLLTQLNCPHTGSYKNRQYDLTNLFQK
ncbi:NERD domain-containing protein [Gracilibacillus sp. S3-1-1]|uniref:NERD domain-containing protein n=1 Tax=Gracilibacillus pellucidus TaxID=3095368 RepID=A0ACC6M484_9BACI|nr:NERD domain-containing protein [Gracilibacillus sp. S3-1-1]MDX8045701.1 NERD domain-containing protein [Gracilibacillus sp. S3-1-1]